MVPRPALSFALLLLVVTAGCLTAPPPGTGTETATRTQTPTPTPTAASPAPPTTETPEATESPETARYSTDCPPYLSVEPASDRQIADADRTLAFDDLPAERRRQFERALADDVALEPGSEDFWIGTVVTHEGESYATGAYVC